jgi:hypothetical protein
MKVKQMVIAAVFLWLLAIAGISNANAAQLSVMTGGQATLSTLSKCADASLATTSSGTPTSGGTVYSSVAMSNIPVACQGLLVELRVFGAGGSLLASASATPAASTHDFATGDYTAANVVAVVVRIDGWVFPTTWTAPPPPPPEPAYSCVAINNGGGTPGGGTCTVTNVIVNSWSSGGFQYQQMYFTVTSSHVDFLVTVDFGNINTFAGWTPAAVWTNGNAIKATVPSAYSCASLPVVQVNRNKPWNPANNSYELQVSTDPNAWAGQPALNRICP